MVNETAGKTSYFKMAIGWGYKLHDHGEGMYHTGIMSRTRKGRKGGRWPKQFKYRTDCGLEKPAVWHMCDLPELPLCPNCEKITSRDSGSTSSKGQHQSNPAESL